MSFLKSLFGGKQEAKNSNCCNVQIVEVKEEEAATAEAADSQKTEENK